MVQQSGRFAVAVIIATFATAVWHSADAQQRDFHGYPEPVVKYLTRIYGADRQPLAFRDDAPGGFERWQADARAALVEKLGMKRIADSVGDHQPTVELSEAEDQGDYLRQKGTIETEPDVRIPFWLLTPKGEGPRPIGLFPHGHSSVGHDTSAGVYANEATRQRAIREDRDVAVQAVKRGFLAIAPAIRGLSTDGIPDLNRRHGERDCRSHVMHCLAVGRTATGERVWDMQRLLDWAQKRPDVDASTVLMMGNSGGGMVTLFAAACDERIGIAVPSCSFAPTVNSSGYLFHCDCNMVPGLLDIGGLAGVAGLIAPRRLLAINGRNDPLFENAAIEEAAADVKRIYAASGEPDSFSHRWGDGGHRFYSDLMWPFIENARSRRSSRTEY